MYSKIPHNVTFSSGIYDTRDDFEFWGVKYSVYFVLSTCHAHT